MNILEKIPTFVTVGVLVVIFACLKRHERCARLQLWAVGWFLVFIHFLSQLLEPASGPVNPFLLALDLGSLQASAIAFLVSVSSVVEDSAKRTMLWLVLGVPAVAYAVLDCYEVHARWPFIACLAVCFCGGVLFFWWIHRKWSLYLAITAFLCASAAAWGMWAALHGSFDEGLTALLGIGFGLPGVFICRNYWRPSPAILTMSGGFLCWGAVFPVGMLMDRLAPNFIVPAELWNVPKLFVAFGMILATVEDKSESIVGMQRKAQALNRQLERFSAITSRLLSGTNVESLCPEIACAITEVSNFSVAAIYLQNAEHRLHLAGSNGLSEQRLQSLQSRTGDWTSDDFKSFCSQAQRVGQSSFLLAEDPTKPSPDFSQCWSHGDELLIPLCSARGAYLGCITLAAPRDPSRVNAQELSRIELLAGDLAVALELKSLHLQLVCSEKLAALGQLVAGVAHELNNPLTAVMGYGELIGDVVKGERPRDHVSKLIGEARRMKKIIDNLLRFSRQSAKDKHKADLAPIVQEVLCLRAYYLRTHNVQIEIAVEPNLASLAIDEDEIKQILLNLVNNSSDALDGTVGEKRIWVRAYQSGARAILEVEDTGPGFMDLNRALDPFYTTKPVGKGTGLGLSICYGIAKEHGGDMRIENASPRGARVIVELPIAAAAPQPLAVAVAHA